MSKKNRRGLNLIEVMILIAVVGGLSILVIAGMGSCLGKGSEDVEGTAQEYAQKMGIKVTGVSCMNNDSDGDGYVSCSLSTKKADGGVEIIPIECAARWSFGTGCKAKVVQIKGVQ